MREKVLTLAQKVFVVKNYYQMTDMFEVRLSFNRRYSMDLSEKVLEMFFKIITQFELTGSVTKPFHYDEGESEAEEEEEPQSVVAPPPVRQKRTRKQHAPPPPPPATTPRKKITLSIPESDCEGFEDFVDDSTDAPEETTPVPQNTAQVIEWTMNEQPLAAPIMPPKISCQERDLTPAEIAKVALKEDAEFSDDPEDNKSANHKLPKKPRVECCICHKSYVEDFIRAHMRKHDKEGCQYFCQACGVTFDKYDNLELHEETHIPDNKFSFMCDSCPEKFVSEKKLTVHLKIHEKPKSFVCEKCGVVYTKQHSLQVHMRSHTGEKPLKCRDCDESFALYGALKSHMRKHTEGIYKCNLCTKSFAYKTELTNHQREHSGVKPYVCHICQRACATAANLRNHIKILHKIELTLEEIQERNFTHQ